MRSSQWLQDDLDRYWDVLQRSQLADKSIEDYYYFAECFVRWTRGQFTPGRTLVDEEARDGRAT
jgi:hypothetical protein